MSSLRDVALAIGAVAVALGYYGVDRYLLPRLGTSWRPGTQVSPARQSELRA